MLLDILNMVWGNVVSKKLIKTADRADCIGNLLEFENRKEEF